MAGAATAASPMPQPPPNSADDDGRMLSELILQKIADAITAQYTSVEAAQFLAEEDIPPGIISCTRGGRVLSAV